MVCHPSKIVPFTMEYDGVNCIAETGGVFGDRIQYHLKIGWGCSDHPQQLADCRLLLQRLCLFSKQPRVLNSDDSLVRKCLEQGDLLFGEWEYLGAPNQDHPDRRTILEQGRGYRGSHAKPHARIGRKISLGGVSVGNVDRLAIEPGTAGMATALDHELRAVARPERRNVAVMGAAAKVVTLALKNQRIVGST